MAPTLDDLFPGVSVEQALAAFRDGCNHGPDRLWITESWIEPRFAKLRARAGRKVGQYAAQKVGHLRAVHSTWFRPDDSKTDLLLRGV